MKWLEQNRQAIYPLCIAWYSVLTLAAEHTRRSGAVLGVGLALAIATCLAVSIWLISGLVTRESNRRVVIASLLVAWMPAHSYLFGPLVMLGIPAGVVALVAVALAAAATGIMLLAKRGIATAASFTRAAAIILLVLPALSLGWDSVAGASNRAGMADAPDTPVLQEPSADAPSVFLIVLDKYTGSRSLLANYGFDNSGFEDELRDMGFAVPNASRSNYPHTWMTLASMLNWRLLDELHGGDHRGIPEVHASITDNRTWRFLRERGYEFVFLPSTYVLTRRNDFADRQLPRPRRSGVNVAEVWLHSTPFSQLIPLVPGRGANSQRSTPVLRVFPYPVETAAEIDEKFRILARLAREPGRRFVFAHLLVPHEPFIFDAECRHLDPFWPPTDYVEDQAPIRAAYIDQLTCVNRKVLQLVADMLEGSDRPPVILLQADHGHGMIAVNPLFGHQLPMHELAPAQIDERTDIFAAYYLPDGGEAVVYDSITPVNLLPAVLNYYFDAGIPLNEDATYWGRFHPPLELTRVR